ncbi:hypothetical protein [Frigidibacter oleivorans]|uniref:hypothetical protein n=1 Tax=Frigidibacter oleivorans TaxID=2487129 RepID=UPI000F8F31BC|nr:hypothetical protein [Frigidibacter oleivorans]
MAIKQSAYFKGNSRTPVPNPHRKGEVIEYMFTHVFAETVAAADILDLFPIFPYGRIVGFDCASENLGAVNLTIGLMSGSPGSLDAARTSGSELVNAGAAGAPATTALTALAALAQNGDTPVSVGLKTSADIVAGATKKLHCRIRVVS